MKSPSAGTNVQKTRFPYLFRIVCPVLAGLTSITVRAQDPDTSAAWKSVERILVVFDSTKARTENDVVALALNQSRKCQYLSTNVEIAEDKLASSGAPPNPELRISQRLNEADMESDHYYEKQFGVRIRFPELGEMGLDKEKARTNLCDQKVDQIRYQQELTARVRRDFADVLASDRLAELSEQKVNLMNRRIGMIEHLMHIGDRSIVFFLKAKAMRAEALNDYARAVQKQGSNRRQMMMRTGLGLDTPLIEASNPDPPKDLEEAVRIANLNRPETGLVKQEIELAVKQRNVERLKLVPWINYVQFSYNQDQTRGRDWKDVRVGIEIPILDLNIGNIKATDLSVRKSEARYDGVLETIEEEVRSAYSLYRDLWLDWKNFSVSSENLIRESSDVIAQSSKYETLRSDEVFELEMTIIETRQHMAEKKRDLAYALSKLLFAMGVDRLQPLP
jgi:outer membrane protein, heavy metal efflux system